MTLGDLLARAGVTARLPEGGGAVPEPVLGRVVTDLAYDSRQAGRGAVFVALPGARHDGAQFAVQAVARGAVAVIAQVPPPEPLSAPWLVVDDARSSLAPLAAAFFGFPSESLLLVGLTGTNGKTTTAYLVTEILERGGWPCGRIGTVGYRIGGQERGATRTTPEAPDVERLLREMVDEGARACVMEVSSHALALHRVDALRFTAAVFTNLTRDHLDFHGDMESYFRAKRRLFEMLPRDGVAVTNADDPRGRDIVAGSPRIVTYALNTSADVAPAVWQSSIEGLTMSVRTPRGSLQLRSGLVGTPNAYNVLAAVAVCVALDVPFDAIEQGVAAVRQVPGRFQVVSTASDDVVVVVDYAHTDDALRNLLETARPIARRRLVTVFGCGGDRDRTKRPLMGAVAARLSDLVIVTSDNPRSEDPDRIVAEIQRGFLPPQERLPSRVPTPPPSVTPNMAIIDRRKAIEFAIRQAQAGDLVVIAGKGHEKYQEAAGRVVPFDDVEVAAAALAQRRQNSRVG